jgi:multidrug efflux pump subunit AcrB
VKILERAVDRPLPVFLAAVLVVFFGLWCLSRLPVKRAPQVEIPFAVVHVPYVGASPEDVESEITVDLDEDLNTLDDLRHLTSIASHGVSTHVLEFEDRADMTESVRSVRDETSLAEADFPDDADPPIVREISFDDLPIVFFTLSGGSDPYRLRDIAEDLAPRLESVAGVSQVDVFGGLEREVQVLADPLTLAQHGLTLADLATALGTQSHNRPTGELRGDEGRRLIRATGEFRGLEEIRELAVKSGPAGTLHLRDVARIEVGHVRRTSASWLDGEPSATLIVKRQPDVNTMETVRQLEIVVDELRSTLPPGIVIETNSDSSQDIARMIRQLGTSAGFGLVLVVGVLFSIFGFRQALLVGSVLPISLLFTFIGLSIFDMEISNIALFSLILVLGLVVDGAIIVGEAIYAESERGAPPAEAAKTGISRVGIPVIAADLTTVAAFVPMLLMVGVMGQFMSVMPKVVTFAIAGSVFVDHLLLPAAAALLPRRARPVRRVRDRGDPPWFSTDLVRLRSAYTRLLERVLHRRVAVVALAALAFVGAMGAFASGLIDSIFLPSSDHGRFTVNYAQPLGTPLAETDRVGLVLASHVAEIPEVEHFVLTTGDTGALSTDGREGGRVGPEYGRIAVELVEASDRERSQAEIVRWLRDRISGYAGIEIDVDEVKEGPSVGAALAVRVKGEEMADIEAASRAVEQTLAGLDASTDVRVDYDRSRPEVRVELDRARAAAQFGITPDQVSTALLTAFYGIEVGRMWVGNERVDIRLRAPDETPHTPDMVGELPLRTATGDLVPLGEIATLRLEYGENAIFRHDSERTVTVRADAIEGASSVALEQAARTRLEELRLPKGIHLEYGGETEERDRSYASLWSALKWGLLLIYVIIAIQFNSLLQPLIVVLTVPLSIVGVTLGLLVTNTPFSFMVFIGVVSLTGIVVNDGIVMVDAINWKRREGTPLREALTVASGERLRPVLLTTVTTVAGLLPLTLNITTGGEFWVPLGVAIISGLLVASGLTLFVVPVLYSLVEAGRARWSARPEAIPDEAAGTEQEARRAHDGAHDEAEDEDRRRARGAAAG